MPRVSFNGRFLNAPATGVQRVARELIVALVTELGKDEKLQQALSLSLICPPNTSGDIARIDLPKTEFGFLGGQLWEQFDLPRADQGDLLVNLCNVAPISARSAITMIHDAQVFLTPESYSRAFAAWYRFALPRIGKSAKRILTVSDYSADQLAHFGVAPREKITTVHNGVDHILSHDADVSLLPRLALQPNTYSVGLANTQSHKNVAVLLEAFRNPALSAQKLVLFGSGSQEDFHNAGLNLPKNVQLAGRMSDGELRALIEQAAALVFPSKTEGFGLPPLEAMVLGTSAVCAKAGALPEVCGDAALYADPDDPDEWVQQIQKLTDGTAESRHNRALANQKQAAQFTWESAGKKLLNIIADTVKA